MALTVSPARLVEPQGRSSVEIASIAIRAKLAPLLDGRLEAIALENPPATQNAPSNPDGTGEAIEMLNCLRFTDLPYVAGMLCPTDLVFVGEMSESYKWAKELYDRMGKQVHDVERLADYHNEP